MKRETSGKPAKTPGPPAKPALAHVVVLPPPPAAEKTPGPETPSRGGRPRKPTGQDLLIEIIARVATGATLTAIALEPGMPSPPQFRKAVALDPTLQDLWEVAKAERVHALFEEAIDLSRELKTRSWAKDETNTVRAKQVAIDALRTAAARLNPREYGDRQSGKVVVPVQINTTLSLRGKPAPDPRKESYSYAIEHSAEEPFEP